jgi:midasin
LGDPEDLRIVVRAYLQNIAPNSTVADDIVNFYLEAKNESNTNLSDGSNHKPHYSLRTLCRALEYIQITAKDYGFPRAV